MISLNDLINLATSLLLFAGLAADIYAFGKSNTKNPWMIIIMFGLGLFCGWGGSKYAMFFFYKQATDSTLFYVANYFVSILFALFAIALSWAIVKKKILV